MATKGKVTLHIRRDGVETGETVDVDERAQGIGSLPTTVRDMSGSWWFVDESGQRFDVDAAPVPRMVPGVGTACQSWDDDAEGG